MIERMREIKRSPTPNEFGVAVKVANINMEFRSMAKFFFRCSLAAIPISLIFIFIFAPIQGFLSIAFGLFL